MRGWAPENQPEIFIKGSELARTLLALARANRGATPGYIAALIDVATAYGVEAGLQQRLVALGYGDMVIEGGQRMP